MKKCLKNVVRNKTISNDLHVVNNVAETAIKLITKFNRSLTYEENETHKKCVLFVLYF